MDKRRAERLPLAMSVQLIAHGVNRLSCQMKDISLGGALLEMREWHAGSDEHPLSREDVVLIRMFLGKGEAAREHEFRARVAHVDSELLGVSFINPNPATLSTLLEIAKEAAVTPGSLSLQGKAMVKHVGDLVLAYCRSHFPDFIKKAEEGLLAAEDISHSNNEKRLFQDAITLIHAQQTSIQSRFLAGLEESFTHFDTVAGKTNGHLDASRLALVGKNEFEEWLAVKVMASRMESACAGQIFALQVRLDELGHTQPGRQTNPFAPLLICEAFHEAIAIQRPTMAVEKVLYQAFEQSMLPDLGGMYKSLNVALVKRGLLPELELSNYVQRNKDVGVAQHRHSSMVGNTPDQGSRATPRTDGHKAAPAGMGLRKEDDTVVATGASPALHANQPLPPPHSAAEFLQRAEIRPPQHGLPASPRDVGEAAGALKSLFRLQHARHNMEYMRAGAGGEEQPAGSLLSPAACFGIDDVQQSFGVLKAASREWRPALESMAEKNGAELADSVQSLVQMTEGLLSTLGQNQIIGQHAKEWFQKLELPLLHALMNDDDLFQRDDHPARQVLNRLARLGFKDYPLTREQKQHINRLIDDIADGFDCNPDVFSKALSDLDPLVKRQDQAFEHNLERVRQMAEGEHRLESARQCVQERLDARLAGKTVPQPVLSLLDAGWRDLLVTTHLRQGEGSKDWQRYLGVLDELLVIGADVDRSVDFREMVKLIQSGLQKTMDIDGRQQQVMTELKHLLAGPQRLQMGDVAWVQVPAKRKEEGHPDEERRLQKWMERALRLQLGDWLEIRHHGTEAERMRLAWRAADNSHFVFVNHQCIKVNDFTLRKLAELMHTGNALIFVGNDAPVVDDALERVVFQLYDQLASQAMHDELTGLINRGEFTRQLERALDEAKRQRARHVLGYINIDQFKLINSTSGFAAGDQLLKDVGHLFGKALKAKTTVSRLNADEFGVLLEDCDIGKAQQLIGLRLGELSAMKFEWAGQAHKLTASAGLIDITYSSENQMHILRSAEEACAQAKADGGDRIQIYQPDNVEMARRDSVLVWVAKINQALENERLTLRCQKIQAISPMRQQNELPHYEILLGIRDAEGEDIPPSVFVESAERYNRMHAVDRWVVGSSFHWLKTNSEKLARIGMVSINLSGHSLSDAKMMGFLFDQLLEYKLPTEKICFEITETTAIRNLPDAVDLMRELKKVGCRFALDDFGMGHATYSYLKHLPVDFLKIDGAFIKDIMSNENDCMMVRSINDLAHYMGIQTIAEYVENDAILARLAEIGVDYAQGYGIEKPRWLDGL